MTTDQTVRSAHPLEALIDTAFEGRASITPSTAERALLDALDRVIGELNAGTLRVAEKRDGTWVTNQWIKKAVLLYFRTHDNEVMPDAGGGAKHAVVSRWFDKVPVKFDNSTPVKVSGLRPLAKPVKFTVASVNESPCPPARSASMAAASAM